MRHARDLAAARDVSYAPWMFNADPKESRQLATAGPMALWRDGEDGGREGLLLSVHACMEPTCPCRKVRIDGWLVTGDLSSIDSKVVEAAFRFGGTPHKSSQRALLASVNVDTGEVAADTEFTTPSAIEWFKKELDPEMMKALVGQCLSAKARPVEASAPFDWRKDDWSWWNPGHTLTWNEFHPGDDELQEIVLDGEVFVVGDIYCSHPNCDCDEVDLLVWREVPPDGELTDVGFITVAKDDVASAHIHAHGPNRALVKRIWKAWNDAHPVGRILAKRRAAMRELLPEFLAHIASARAVPTKAKVAAKKPATKDVGPNTPCPCGSGKKFKRCCMGA